MQIDRILKEIQEEAQVLKSQPPHPDSQNLKKIRIQIVKPPPPLFIRAIQKLRQYGWQSPKMLYLWIASIPKWGYPLLLLRDLVRLPKRFADLQQRLQDTNDLLDSHFIGLNNRIDTELWSKHEQEIRIMNSRLSGALNHLKQLDKKVESPTAQNSTTVEQRIDEHWLDQFYVDFENQFRGTFEDILQRQSIYIPYLQKSEVNFEKNPVLDIGCGRGEWLQTLKNMNIKAKGIDMNQMMVVECQRSGLEVQELDVMEYLNTLEAESIGAVTGFHIVEHLPFSLLIQLLDECLRVLTSGGIVIFETPNPENLMVGSCNFYTDPTHRNPIPPHTLSFMLTQRGFAETSVLRLAPLATIPGKNKVAPELQKIVESYYKEQDYAVIAKKF